MDYVEIMLIKSNKDEIREFLYFIRSLLVVGHYGKIKEENVIAKRFKLGKVV